MPLTSPDQELVQAMKQREFHVKSRQRAVEHCRYELRRYQFVLIAAAAVVGALVSATAYVALTGVPDTGRLWRGTVVAAALGAACGVLLMQALLRTDRGRRHLAGKERRIQERYSADLHAGRRWLRFYYQGEDISPYIPQLLSVLDSERSFDSVDAALAFVRNHDREGLPFAERALERLANVASQTTVVIIASSDAAGHPSARAMRFVTGDRPGAWYVTTAPEGAKVGEFDRGQVALVTVPTESGATISSNRVRVRRIDSMPAPVADTFREQVPGYLDGMSEAELEQELVYELSLESARVDTWFEHHVVEFDDPADTTR